MSISAQPYSLDTSFTPFFDITTGIGKGYVSDIYEDSKGRVFITGTFNFSLSPNISNDGLTSTMRDGSQNTVFQGYSGGADLFVFANDSSIMLGGVNIFNIPIDSTGAIQNWPWINNIRNTVGCHNDFAIPYYFPDGSSIHGNGIDNFGQPCQIINLPDTFAGRHLIKVDPQGKWDSTWLVNSTEEPIDIIEYDNNRLLLVGNPRDFRIYNNQLVYGLCRIYKNGSLDTTFHSPLMDTSSNVKIAIVESNGKILLAGNFWLKNQRTSNTLVRLNSDGSLDNSFANSLSPTDTLYGNSFANVSAVEKTADNGYLVGGNFNNYQGQYKNNIAKIDSLGNLEPQYFTSLGPDSSLSLGNLFSFINVIKKSKYGGYYVGGDFLKWDGNISQPIIRIFDLSSSTNLLELNNSDFSGPMIFPNPSQGRFNLTSQIGITQLQIYSLEGTLLKTFSKPKNHINLESFKNGIYLIRISTNKEVFFRRVIISR